jgi:hypothetical protein
VHRKKSNNSKIELIMSKITLFRTIFVLMAFCFFQCATIQVTESAKSATKTPIKKILFVENVNDEQTYDFYNKLRRSLKQECAVRGIQTDFVRLTAQMADPQLKLTTAKTKLQPDLIFNLQTDNLKGYKWGPLNNAIRKINVSCNSVTFPAETAHWSGNLYIEQAWGVDVSTDKAAKKLFLSLMLND